MSISLEEYQQRRQTLMEKIGQGTAIFRSAPLAVMHNDVEYPFRQDSDFYYLSGFDEEEAVLVLAPHHEQHQFILFVQPKNVEKETWTGYRIGVEAAKKEFGADEAYPIEELDEKLPDYLKQADCIYYHFGRDEAFNNKVLNHWRKLIAQFPKRGTAPSAIADTNFILHPLRQVKSDQELSLIRHAVDIATEAHNQALTIAKPGKYEYEIQAEIEYIFSKHGAKSPAYPTIVASGKNACILHYIDNNKQLEENDLLLIDAGCCYQYYNSDITRTFPVSGKFTPEQKTIYELVLEAQLKAIDEVKPGNTYNQFHDKAVRVLVEGLVDLGILQGNVDEIIEQEEYKSYYMHRTGHWLGLDVHDVGGYKVGEDHWQTLQPGQVLTVEPGLYLSPNAKLAEGQPELPQRWHGIGVRIEDDVLVTRDGNEVLSAGVPKSVEAMENGISANQGS